MPAFIPPCSANAPARRRRSSTLVVLALAATTLAVLSSTTSNTSSSSLFVHAQRGNVQQQQQMWDEDNRRGTQQRRRQNNRRRQNRNDEDDSDDDDNTVPAAKQPTTATRPPTAAPLPADQAAAQPQRPRTQPSAVWASTLLPLERGCPSGIRVRKEVRDMLPAEWSAYAAAVRQLQASGIYDRLVKIHIDLQTPIHNYAQFLPWHRMYVLQFELHLRRINPNVVVPYWAWSVDSQAPETSAVLSARYYGGNGVGAQHCVQDGAFSSWRPYYPRGRHCLRRDYDLGSALSAWYGPEAINRAIASSTSYDSFRRQIEYPIHASPHANIGSDFSSMASPNDPLFFAHHAFVDKQWRDWAQANPQLALTYGGLNMDGQRAAVTDYVEPWNARVRDVLDTRSLCYTYAETSASIPVARARAAGTTPTFAAATGAQQAQTQVPQQPQTGRRLVRRSEHEERPDAYTGDADVDSDVESAPHAAFTTAPSNYIEPANAYTPSTNHTVKAVYTAPLPTAENDGDRDLYSVSYADRQNLLAVRTPRPIPESWAKMNRVNLEELRSVERDYADMCRELNRLPTYTSPCALYNHPRALEVLAPKVKTFYAVTNGTRVVPFAGGDLSQGRRPSTQDLVSQIRRSVLSQAREKVIAPAQTFAAGLKRAIGGRIVQHTLRSAYPTLSEGGVNGSAEYSDDEDEVCDADYDDAAEQQYDGEQYDGAQPQYDAPAPLVSDNTAGTTQPPPTYTPAGAKPNHSVRAPVPVQTGAYKMRDSAPKNVLVDGGDYYDEAPLKH